MHKFSSKSGPHTSGHKQCPYDFEVTKDGRMIVEGEDYGDAEQFFAEGQKLREITRLWHEVSTAS